MASKGRMFPKDTPKSISVEKVYLANFLFLLGKAND